MKLIATELGRAVRLVPAEDIRPHGGTHAPSALRMVTERYEFAYSPDLRRPWEDIEKEGFKFRLGKMSHGDKTINIGEFTIYTDGLVATALSTDDAEIFLADLTAWGKETLGFRDPSIAKGRTLYLSYVVVEFDSSPNSLLSHFSRLSETLGALLHESYGIETSPQLSSLGMNFDRTMTLAPSIGVFVLERRANQPYSINRFYSEAPLRTQDHLAFLELIESTFNGGRGPSQKKDKTASESPPLRAIELD